jgi:hypothetical protein
VIARLRDGISRGEARAEIATIAQELKQEYGTQTDAFNFGLAPLRERMVKNVRGLLLVLGGAVVSSARHRLFECGESSTR